MLCCHSTTAMTCHYSVAQIVELHAALEKVKDDNGRWNKSSVTLRSRKRGGRDAPLPQKSPHKEKRPRSEKPLSR